MDAATESQTRPRIPLIAALLSLVVSGLGQVYCGRIGRGIVLWFVNTVCAAFALVFGVMVLAEWDTSLGYAATAALGAGAAIWVYAIVDALRIARRTQHYILKDYNRWYIYLLLALIELPLGVPVAIGLREGAIQAFVSATDGMAPTLREGDRILVSKLAYRTQPVRRGDVVAHVNPNKRSQTNIKRVVGLPGDTVELRDGMLLLNGLELRVEWIEPAPEPGKFFRELLCRETNDQVSYPILITPPPATSPANRETATAIDFPPTKLANGYCFVLNDNRGDTYDSRSFGPVPLRDVVGRADVVYWPRWASLRPRGK